MGLRPGGLRLEATPEMRLDLSWEYLLLVYNYMTPTAIYMHGVVGVSSWGFFIFCSLVSCFVDRDPAGSSLGHKQTGTAL